ncbi:ribonuclease domain-containing protein [Nocardia acidivorans]|uniref:ribonuclease domain-containing protein n=1 Tax=Nocardia acidivorans TaxID=404580 RepID=UPI00082A800A|nr:ribonuclease domain-containing protein [Nocardia acidivorans]
MNVSKRTRAWLVLGGALVLVLAAILLSRGGGTTTNSNQTVASTVAGKTTTAVKPGPRTTVPGAVDQQVTPAPGVPDRAYKTLGEIDAGRWPGSANAPGTHGGDTWMNRGGDLPAKDSSGKKISYQEWDVNPKKAGQGRDAERIITGSDGSAYYTGDHYNTFTRMR